MNTTKQNNEVWDTQPHQPIGNIVDETMEDLEATQQIETRSLPTTQGKNYMKENKPNFIKISWRTPKGTIERDCDINKGEVEKFVNYCKQVQHLFEEPASQKQIQFAQSLQIAFTLPITKNKLSELIDQATKNRQQQGGGQYPRNNNYPQRNNYNNQSNYRNNWGRGNGQNNGFN